MYGLNLHQQMGILKSAAMIQPHEQTASELQWASLRSRLYEFQETLGIMQHLPALVTQKVIEPQEARKILDVDAYLALIDEIKAMEPAKE